MAIVAMIFAILAVAGWIVASYLYSARKQHVCPIEPPKSAVLLNYAGLPESHRALRGDTPKTYSRPRGDKPAIVYERIGTAVVYKATAPKS